LHIAIRIIIDVPMDRVTGMAAPAVRCIKMARAPYSASIASRSTVSRAAGRAIAHITPQFLERLALPIHRAPRRLDDFVNFEHCSLALPT